MPAPDTPEASAGTVAAERVLVAAGASVGFDPSAPADPALIAAARAGEAFGFERLMRRYNRLLFRAVRGVLDSDADAQDAVQEAWLLAFTRLGSFRGESAFPTWLVRIAINVALGQHRRRGRDLPVDAAIDPEAEPPETQMTSFQLPARETPESELQRTEMRALLERAIDALPPLYRTVFILRSVQEMAVDEVAQALGVSADVVKTRHLRARALLRDAIGAQLEGDIAQAFAFAGARCDRVVATVLAALEQRGLLPPEAHRRIRPG